MAAWPEAANVTLGWFLGFASAQFIDWRRGKKRAAATKRAILFEFDELAFRLSAVFFKLELQYGRLGRETLEQVARVVNRYEGPNKSDRMPVGMAELLETSDAELAALTAQYRSLQKSSFVPHEDAPYTAAMASQLHELAPEFAARVLDILSRLRIFNELRESGARWSVMTFDSSLSEENHARITQNAENADRQLAREARIIIDKLLEVRQQYGS